MFENEHRHLSELSPNSIITVSFHFHHTIFIHIHFQTVGSPARPKIAKGQRPTDAFYYLWFSCYFYQRFCWHDSSASISIFKSQSAYIVLQFIMATKAVKFLPHLKEIRIHLCQKSDASKGVRYYPLTIFLLSNHINDFTVKQGIYRAKLCCIENHKSANSNFNSGM